MDHVTPVEQARTKENECAISRQQIHRKVETLAEFGRNNLAVDHSRPTSINIATPTRQVNETLKMQETFIRLLDVIGASVMILSALPVMLVVSNIIKMLSPGPILYKQERVGKNGKIFVLYKFRSMIDDAEKNVGPVWASQNDNRVTSIGKIMRKMRIDELPQLYNVLRGDMSLVGPRPERPFFVRRHQSLQGIRLGVKPGLTGLAQIRAFYDLKPEHKVKYDYLYIQKRSLGLNLLILIKTIPVVIRKTGW